MSYKGFFIRVSYYGKIANAGQNYLNTHIYILAFEHKLTCVLRGSSIFFGKKLIICVYYNLGLLYFPITKISRGVMSIMR